MEFAELTSHEKAKYTFNEIKKKKAATKAAVIKGQKDADNFTSDNYYKIKARLRGFKKVSIKD
jgi:hypothetical protein